MRPRPSVVVDRLIYSKRSLTLDMLRRNGRRTAPRSAPHHSRSGVRTDGINSDDDAYRQQLATCCTENNGGLADGQPLGRGDDIIDHHNDGEPQQEAGGRQGKQGQQQGKQKREDRKHGGRATHIGSEESGEGGDSDRETGGGTGEVNVGDTEEAGGGGSPKKPSTAGTLTITGEASPPGESRTSVAARKGRPSSAPAPAPALENVGVKRDVSTLSVSGTESDGGDGNGGGAGGCNASSASSSSPLPSSGLVLEDIELVNLHNLSLHKLEGIERLVRLRVADLSGNELHDTAPLRWCSCLEVRFTQEIISKFLHV